MSVDVVLQGIGDWDGEQRSKEMRGSVRERSLHRWICRHQQHAESGHSSLRRHYGPSPPAADQCSEFGVPVLQTHRGAKHFEVWPLSEAAHACFGTEEWPATRPIPQSTIEFEVDDVEAAAAELHGEGYGLVHPVRTEPWGQVIERFQSPDGVLLGVCSTPHLADA